MSHKGQVRILHAQGLNGAQIAKTIGISTGTVSYYLRDGITRDIQGEVELRTRQARQMFGDGATKRTIADKLGVSPSTVAGYIRGMRPPEPAAARVPNRETPCSTYPHPELWFAMESDSLPMPAKIAATEEAVAICGACPVRAACLQYALDVPMRHGVWGGLTQAERKALLKQRRAA